MSQATAVRAAVPKTTTSASALLTCGVIAGPLFIVVAFAQVFTRSGFELARHPLSLLSLGDLGWLQITNFVLAGLLFIASSVGMRRRLGGHPGGTWGPRLMGVFGVSLIAGGVFLADPAFGFPPGSPPGAPDQLSWHGIAHASAPAIGFSALIASAFALARWYSRAGQRGWSAFCVVTGAVVLLLSMWPNLGGDPEGRFGPLWAAMVLGFGWASAIAGQLRSPIAIDSARVIAEDR